MLDSVSSMRNPLVNVRQLLFACTYWQTTWKALCGEHPSAADEPDATLGNVLIINQEIREAWLAIRNACQVAEGFWDFFFEQADHGHLPEDTIKLVKKRITFMKGRWFRRAGNFRELVEPLAKANFVYMKGDEPVIRSTDLGDLS